MEFAEVVRRRRMVRDYATADTAPVDPGAVDRMLAHAQRAPSAGFAQGTSWLRLDDPGDVALFWRTTSAPDARPDADSAWLRGMRAAPVVLVALADESAYRTRYAEPDKTGADQAFDVPWWHVDAGMAALLVLQTAVEEGLGACFFGVPGDRWNALRRAFGIPGRMVPTGAITLGHPAPGAGGGGSPSRRGRRDPHDVVRRGRWDH